MQPKNMVLDSVDLIEYKDHFVRLIFEVRYNAISARRPECPDHRWLKVCAGDTVEKWTIMTTLAF